MSGRRKVAWPEANQAYLVAEFARLKQLLSAKPEDPERAAKAVAKAKAALKTPPAIDRLTELFNLSEFERELLLLCAGVEMDSNLAAECAQAQGARQRAYLTFGLAMAILPNPHWSALTSARSLRFFRLLEVDAGANLTTAPLRIDERILHYLAGINLLDPRLESLLHISPSPSWIAEKHRKIALQLEKAIESYSQHSLIVHLCGDDPQGQEDATALAAQNTSRQLLVLQAEEDRKSVV